MKVVVWSGGADSTLVLLDALMADEEGVRALSLEHPQLGRASQRKLQAFWPNEGRFPR